MTRENLEDYIARINKAQSAEDAFETLTDIVKDYGYNQVVYSLMTDHPSLGLPEAHGFAVNYPEHWMKYYFEHNYTAIDPVRKNITDNPIPFFWSEMIEQQELTDSEVLLMNEAHESGVQDGIGISMFGKLGEIAGIGLARSDQEKTRNYEDLSHIQLLSMYFHEKNKSFIKQDRNIYLTNREQEIITWAAEGKTDPDISDILNISENTVRFHWKNIFKKLDAYGRVYAITKAIRMQLISPNRIQSSPTRNGSYS
jgi:DNA-binding CsgD family transcriptional regulator